MLRFAFALVGCLFPVMAVPHSLTAAERSATPAESIQVFPGFRVELLRSAQPGEGSWISMTFDDKGRLILGEDTSGLLRLTLNENPAESKLERLPNLEALKHCRGVLWTPHGLYAVATNGAGLYRLRQKSTADVYDEVELLIPLEYQSRYGHGANQLTLGPDGMLYIAIGNDVQIPPATDPHSPFRNWQNDWALPNPHDLGQDNRTGIVLKVDPDARTRTIVAGGLRNQVDVAFNEQGELFTWDADMEWDVGLPWYRPTRLLHVVSGGEYGWRWGTGKRPSFFPDQAPATQDTGLGSPTGLVFGTGSQWPERFRKALFGADWQHGRILMFEMTPRGASYNSTSSVFAEGSPLNVCDMAFGPDGALYFITGGRGSQSGLYRMTIDPSSDQPQPAGPDAVSEVELAAAAAAREVRHQLEKLHQKEDAGQLDFIWSHLGSDDPSLRFAARVALENQPLDSWRRRAATSGDSPARHTALLALARVGAPVDQKIVVKGLREWDWNTAEPAELVWGLRALEISLARHGTLDDVSRPGILRKMHALPVQESFPLNWLSLELLVALKSPEAIPRGLTLLASATTQEEEIQYIKTLDRVKHEWSAEQREPVLNWLAQNRQLRGGKLMKNILLELRDDFLATFTSEEKTRFSEQIALLEAPVPEEETAALPARPLVQAWTMQELESDVISLRPQDRSLEGGRSALRVAICLRCHQFDGRGGHVGPDLTSIGKRFDSRALLESILEPSKVIDPKYHNAAYELEDGRIVTGRAVSVSKEQIGIEVDPLTGNSITVPRAEIVSSKSSPVSPMPQGLLNTLTKDEILDLIAYLRSK